MFTLSMERVIIDALLLQSLWPCKSMHSPIVGSHRGESVPTALKLLSPRTTLIMSPV